MASAKLVPVKRWANAELARRHSLDVSVAKKIEGAVKKAKAKGLNFSATSNLIEDAVGGRKLTAAEHNVARAARSFHNEEGSSESGGFGDKFGSERDKRISDEKARERGDSLLSKALKQLEDLAEYEDLSRYDDDRFEKKFGESKPVTRADVFGKMRGRKDDIVGDMEVAADALEEAGPAMKMRATTVRKAIEILKGQTPSAAKQYVKSAGL